MLPIIIVNEKIILENFRNNFVFSSSVCEIALIIRLLSETLFVTLKLALRLLFKCIYLVSPKFCDILIQAYTNVILDLLIVSVLNYKTWDVTLRFYLEVTNVTNSNKDIVIKS